MSIKNGIGFCAVYFCLTLLIKMCFLISIFLCFTLVPKLVPRTVDFHWYWYRILKFWYRDNPSSKQGQYSPNDQHLGIKHRRDREHQYSENKCLPLRITHPVVCVTLGSLTEKCWEERRDKQHP